MKLFKLNIVIIFATIFCLINNSWATTNTWQGGNGSTLNWQTAANWSAGHTPANNEDVVFNTSGALTFTTGVGTLSFNSLTISQGSVTIIGSAASRIITIGGNIGTDFTIASGATLTLGSNLSITMASTTNSDISGSFIINTGSTFNISNTLTINIVYSTGSITNSGTITGATTIKLIFSSNSTYIHSQNGGAIPTASWFNGSNCNITGVTNSIPSGITSQSLSNLTWNCASQSSDLYFGTTFTIGGDFTITNTNSHKLGNESGGSSRTLTVSGNMIINGGSFNNNSFSGDGSETATLNIGRNLTVSSGTFDLCSGGYTYSILNLSGNYTQNGGVLTYSSQYGATNVSVNFNGSLKQIFNQSAGIFTSSKINFNINNSDSLQLASDISLGSGSTMTIASGGLLIFGTGSTDQTNSFNAKGLGSFVLSSGGNISITSTSGISSLGTALGNVLTTGGRTFNTSANYIYIGDAAQYTGNGLITCNNLTLNNSNGLTLSGNVIVNGTCYMTLGSLNLNGKTLFYGASGILCYNSISTVQTTSSSEWPVINGPSNITLNNTNANRVVNLHADRTITNTLTLTSGVLTLGASTLTLGTSASDISTIVGCSSLSYIDASGIGVVKFYHKTTPKTYLFPVGDASNYAPLSFYSGTLTFAAGAYTTLKLKSIPQPNMGTQSSYLKRYWTLSQSGITANSSHKFNISYTYVATDVVGTESNIIPYLYSSSAWTTAGSINVSTKTLTWNGVSSFGDFTGVASNPLPIDLLTFIGKYYYGSTYLTWVTASEINNNYFEIQRSLDADNFEFVGTVLGAGNSIENLNYNYFDDLNKFNIKQNIIYYRLKQIDFDGKSSLSKIISITKDDSSSDFDFQQPFINDNCIYSTISNINGGLINVELLDLIGRIIHKETINTTEPNYNLKLNIENLLKGSVYFLRVNDNRTSIVKKFIYYK